MSSNPVAKALHDSAQHLTTDRSATPRPMQRVDVSAEGASGDGDVRVTIRNARLTDCRVSEAALTLDAVTIGELICTATNAAMEKYEQDLVQALQAQQGTDMAALQRQLEQASREAEQGMADYLNQMRRELDAGKARMANRPLGS